jgi:hypothetical protein
MRAGGAVRGGVSALLQRGRVVRLQRGVEIGGAEQIGDDLALHIHVLVVVVARFRRSHSVADEHHRSLARRCRRLPALPLNSASCRNCRLRSLPAAQQGDRRLGLVHAQRAQRHGLKITALIARGRKAQRFEARRDEGCRDVIAARARAAAFEQVIGKKAHVRANRFGPDRQPWLHRPHRPRPRRDNPGVTNSAPPARHKHAAQELPTVCSPRSLVNVRMNILRERLLSPHQHGHGHAGSHVNQRRHPVPGAEAQA